MHHQASAQGSCCATYLISIAMLTVIVWTSELVNYISTVKLSFLIHIIFNYQLGCFEALIIDDHIKLIIVISNSYALFHKGSNNSFIYFINLLAIYHKFLVSFFIAIRKLNRRQDFELYEEYISISNNITIKGVENIQ